MKINHSLQLLLMIIELPQKKKCIKNPKNIIYKKNINVIKFIINKEKEDILNSDNFNSKTKLRASKRNFIKPKGILK